MSFYLSPVGNTQQIASNGAPLVGGKVYTYLAGTSTPAATYTDNTGVTPQANPIVLDTNGNPASPIWLSGGSSYKFVIKTAADVLVKTIDNVAGINDVSASQNEWIDSGMTPTYISTVSFSVPGDQRNTFQVNRRIKTTNTGGAVYSTVLTSVYATGVTTLTLTNDGTSVIDSGLSAVAYSFLSATYPSLPVLFLTYLALVGQQYTAFTTSGTAPAFTLTPVPPISAYVAGQRFRVKFSASTAAAPTLNVNGFGAKSLMQYDLNGTKVAATIDANMLTDVEFDGTDMVVLNPIPVGYSSVLSSFKNLSISTTGTSATITATCDELSLENDLAQYLTAKSVSLSISGASSGANGLDTGSLAVSTWYSVWVIYNPATSTTAGLLSASATAPTMPSGYTFKARIGWIRTDASGNKYPLSMRQKGRKGTWVVKAGSNVAARIQMASGSAGAINTPTWVAVSTSTVVPSTASDIIVAPANGSSTTIMVAPSNAYAEYTSSTNPGVVSSGIGTMHVELPLESASIYWASNNATCVLYSVGWIDNI